MDTINFSAMCTHSHTDTYIIINLKTNNHTLKHNRVFCSSHNQSITSEGAVRLLPSVVDSIGFAKLLNLRII